MASTGVVEGLDPLEDRRPQIGPGSPALPVEEFALHGRPEGLHQAVVDAGGHPAHRAQQPGGSEPVAEDPGRVLGGINRSECTTVPTGARRAMALRSAVTAREAVIRKSIE